MTLVITLTHKISKAFVLWLPTAILRELILAVFYMCERNRL